MHGEYCVCWQWDEIMVRWRLAMFSTVVEYTYPHPSYKTDNHVCEKRNCVMEGCVRMRVSMLCHLWSLCKNHSKHQWSLGLLLLHTTHHTHTDGASQHCVPRHVMSHRFGCVARCVDTLHCSRTWRGNKEERKKGKNIWSHPDSNWDQEIQSLLY